MTGVGNGALILPKVEVEADPVAMVVVDLIGKVSLV